MSTRVVELEDGNGEFVVQWKGSMIHVSLTLVSGATLTVRVSPEDAQGLAHALIAAAADGIPMSDPAPDAG